MASKHTPGPWSIHVDKLGWHIAAINGPHGRIARVDDYDLPAGPATARLIAVAPRMYEACRMAAKSAHHPACDCRGEQAANPERYCRCHVQAARAVLAQVDAE